VLSVSLWRFFRAPLQLSYKTNLQEFPMGRRRPTPGQIANDPHQSPTALVFDVRLPPVSNSITSSPKSAARRRGCAFDIGDALDGQGRLAAHRQRLWWAWALAFRKPLASGADLCLNSTCWCRCQVTHQKSRIGDFNVIIAT
jgi:hypothetical protein